MLRFFSLLLLFPLLQGHDNQSEYTKYNLHCYSCPEDRNRTYCKPNELGGYVQCLDGEVCAKEGMLYTTMNYNNTKTWLKADIRIKRGCVQFKPGVTLGMLGYCVWQRNALPPFDGFRCLCDDAHFCNGERSKTPTTFDTCLMLSISHLVIMMINMLISFSL